MERLDYLLVVFCLAGSYLSFHKHHLKTLKGIVTGKGWIMNMSIIALFIIYEYYLEKYFYGDDMTEEQKQRHENIKKSIVAGLFAHIIALVAELHMTIAPFWITFIASYYYNSGG